MTILIVNSTSEWLVKLMYQRYADPSKNVIVKNIPKDRFDGSSFGLDSIFLSFYLAREMYLSKHKY